jgi:hypothetical protein
VTRQCTCGGIIRQHELTGEREAWTCNACGKYSAIQRTKGQAMTEKHTENSERACEAQPPTQAEWLEDAARLLRDVRMAVTKQCMSPSEVNCKRIDASDAALMAHLERRPT